MKMVAFITVLLTANFAFANECVSTAQRKYMFEPKEICIQEVNLIGDGVAANVQGTPYSGNFESIGLENNVEILRATVVNQPDDVGCGRHMIQVLTLWVTAEFAAQAGEKRLQKAQLSYEYTPDTCHSELERNLVEYQ